MFLNLLTSGVSTDSNYFVLAAVALVFLGAILSVSWSTFFIRFLLSNFWILGCSIFSKRGNEFLFGVVFIGGVEDYFVGGGINGGSDGPRRSIEFVLNVFWFWRSFWTMSWRLDLTFWVVGWCWSCWWSMVVCRWGGCRLSKCILVYLPKFPIILAHGCWLCLLFSGFLDLYRIFWQLWSLYIIYISFLFLNLLKFCTILVGHH